MFTKAFDPQMAAAYESLEQKRLERTEQIAGKRNFQRLSDGKSASNLDVLAKARRTRAKVGYLVDGEIKFRSVNKMLNLQRRHKMSLGRRYCFHCFVGKPGRDGSSNVNKLHFREDCHTCKGEGFYDARMWRRCWCWRRSEGRSQDSNSKLLRTRDSPGEIPDRPYAKGCGACNGTLLVRRVLPRPEEDDDSDVSDA